MLLSKHAGPIMGCHFRMVRSSEHHPKIYTHNKERVLTQMSRRFHLSTLTVTTTTVARWRSLFPVLAIVAGVLLSAGVVFAGLPGNRLQPSPRLGVDLGAVPGAGAGTLESAPAASQNSM